MKDVEESSQAKAPPAGAELFRKKHFSNTTEDFVKYPPPPASSAELFSIEQLATVADVTDEYDKPPPLVLSPPVIVKPSSRVSDAPVKAVFPIPVASMTVVNKSRFLSERLDSVPANPPHNVLPAASFMDSLYVPDATHISALPAAKDTASVMVGRACSQLSPVPPVEDFTFT